MFAHTKRAILGLLPLLGLSLAVGGAGCKHRDYSQPIADFQKSVDAGTAAISVLYGELNNYERDLYLQHVVLNDQPIYLFVRVSPQLANSDRLPLVDENGDLVPLEEPDAAEVPKNDTPSPVTISGIAKIVRPTPLLVDPFDPASIDARMRLLKQLALYGQSLGKLEGLDAPSRFETNVVTLGTNLKTLLTDFDKLSKDSNKNNDTTARGYIAPITTIIGVVTKEWMEAKRTQSIEAAIKKGKEPVDRLLSFLSVDLDKYVGSTRVTGTRQMIDDLRKYYNKNRSKMDYDTKQRFVAYVRNEATEYKLAKNVPASHAVDSMREAHDALVKYAQEPSDQRESLGELISALDSLKDDVRKIVTAVVQIQELQKERTTGGAS
jgi:hypothetical protein